MIVRHGLVGDGDTPALHQAFGLLKVRGEMKIGEEDLPLPQHRNL